jgi:hypothetical protein
MDPEICPERTKSAKGEKMDIGTMPAGPEMDALVAEKVMGYTSWAFGVPRYSTNLETAWEVVEKMKPVWVNFRLSFGPYLVVDGKLANGWELEPAWCSPRCGYGETAPLAICRAAIKICIE